MQLNVWWRATSLALALIGAGLPFATRALVGPRGAMVHVRWQPATDQAARETLEARFGLTDGERLDDQTWRYDLIDPSSTNIRAIVSDPAAADTHDIDRPNYSLDPAAVRTARRRLFAGGDAAVSAGDGLAGLLATLTALLVVLGISGRASTWPAVRQLLARRARSLSHAARTATAPVARWLSRGIPEIDAQTAGVFRILFGLAVLAFFASHPEDATSLNTFNPLVEGELHAFVLQWLRAHPYIADLLMPWLLTMGVAFTAGALTRLTYRLFVAGVLVWLFVAVSHDSTHPHGTLALTLVALVPSRWGDVLSVDAWLRRRRGGQRVDRPPAKHYGYSVWVPGFVAGVAFAAAAWAKLSGGPGWADWILNGSVKYHFITDSFNAPVDWGVQLARYPVLAIVASLAVVAAEAFVITAAFTRSEWYRLGLGIAACTLLAGFWLFMGVFWPGWWILLLGFLPWQRLGRLKPAPTTLKEPARTKVTYVEAGVPGTPKPQSGEGGSRPQARSATPAQLAMVVGLVAQQIVISALAIERAPMFTHYPMYSVTYASADRFDASMVPYYRIVLSTDRGKVELSCNAPEDLVETFRAALAGSAEAAAHVWRAVRACGGNLPDVHHVTFEGDRRTFDWDRLTFTTTRAAIVLGPLPAPVTSRPP